MLKSQEPKYMIVDANGVELEHARIANRETGKAIPDDEPLMVFRAKDDNAVDAIAAYAGMCLRTSHTDLVLLRKAQFARFKRDNPDRVTEPTS